MSPDIEWNQSYYTKLCVLSEGCIAPKGKKIRSLGAKTFDVTMACGLPKSPSAYRYIVYS